MMLSLIAFLESVDLFWYIIIFCTGDDSGICPKQYVVPCLQSTCS